MKVYFDTNVVIDIWGKSEDYFYSYVALDVSLLRHFEPCIAANTTTDIIYLLGARKYLVKAEARKVAEQLFEVFTVLDVTSHDCKAAAASPIDDYDRVYFRE